MNKGYYIYFGSNSDGVNRKIDMQIAEFSKHFQMEKIIILQKNRTVSEKIKSILPNVGIGYQYDEALKVIQNPDFIYLRRMTADREYLHFFNEIKHIYPQCKIIIEIPSFPYFRDSYCHNWKHFLRSFPYYVKDCIYTKQLKKYVDRIVSFSNDEYIYGIKTIPTMNGICVNDIKMVSKEHQDNCINMISVAMVAPHHGYERIIEGLHYYYLNGGDRNIVYHCVGHGEELDYYKSLVHKYGLKTNVKFYGKRTGKELDKIYDQMDLGLDCFGLYKDKRYFVSSLKAREYLAKGLPVISGVSSDVFEKYPTKFYLEFSNDPSPVDIQRIIEFYDNIYTDDKKTSEVHEDIRNYARNTVDYSIVLKDIISYLKN